MLKLFRFLKPYTLSVALVLVLVAGQSIAELYLPTLMADIVDKGITSGDTAYILRVGGLMLLVAMASMACALVAAYFSARAGMAFGRDLRGKLFAHVEGFSLHEFDIIGTPSLITRTIEFLMIFPLLTPQPAMVPILLTLNICRISAWPLTFSTSTGSSIHSLAFSISSRQA